LKNTVRTNVAAPLRWRLDTQPTSNKHNNTEHNDNFSFTFVGAVRKFCFYSLILLKFQFQLKTFFHNLPSNTSLSDEEFVLKKNKFYRVCNVGANSANILQS